MLGLKFRTLSSEAQPSQSAHALVCAACLTRRCSRLHIGINLLAVRPRPTRDQKQKVHFGDHLAPRNSNA
jgi:hypothetical protein